MNLGTNVSRRGVLVAGSAAIATGLAGCSDSSDPSDSDDSADSESSRNESFEDSTAIDGVEGDGRDLQVTLADDAAVDQLQLLNPDGSEYDIVSASGGATTVSIRLIETAGGTFYRGYTSGENTLVALSDGEVIEEHTIDLAPDLRLADVDIEYLSRTDHEVTVEIENTGIAPAFLEDGALESDYMGRRREFVSAHGSIIGAGESEPFEEGASLPRYDDREYEFDEYCTGEGAFEVELTVALEVREIGDRSGVVDVAGRGDQEYEMSGSNIYTCSDADSSGLPVDLE